MSNTSNIKGGDKLDTVGRLYWLWNFMKDKWLIHKSCIGKRRQRIWNHQAKLRKYNFNNAIKESEKEKIKVSYILISYLLKKNFLTV